MDTTELHRPASWAETLAALGFLLIFPLFFVIALLLMPIVKDFSEPWFGLFIFFAAMGMLWSVLVIGWMKDFPRWVFPYWGVALLISIYMHFFTGTISGYQVKGNWWVWLPLASVMLAGFLWSRTWEPLRRLLSSLWQDWTQLSFAFYGALPLLVIAAYDEVHNEGPFVALILVILGLGAIGYMQTNTPWQRFAWLLGGFMLGWIILIVHQCIYWNGRQEPGMLQPVTWQEALGWNGRFGAALLCILIAPLAVGILRKMVESQQADLDVG